MKNSKILIVEDELLIAENLAFKLKKLGYTVSGIVSSGKAAIEQVNFNCPDLILMDIAIKGKINGIQTAAQIKTIAEIPIVYLTAYADDETLEQAAQTSCYGYLLKPFKDRELHATIKVVLKKHQEQSSIQSSLDRIIDQLSNENNRTNIDSLTQLPNQLCLRELCDFLLAADSYQAVLETSQTYSSDKTQELSSHTNNQNHLAILYLDLDRFHQIADSLGKENSDTLLKAVADRLLNCVDSNEGEAAAIRIQNSEFAIVTSVPDLRVTAKNLARIILECFNEPIVIDNSEGKREIFLTASLGIALYPTDNTEIELLLQQAKLAMKCARQQGGNQYKFYSTTLNIVPSAAEDLSLETELHYALRRQELELYYQPKVNLKTGQIVCSEALLRWNHPQKGLMSPDKFIPIAEASSLIESIGEWVLKEACKQTKAWQQAGFDRLKVAVNLSGRQFKQLDLFHRLTQILFDSTLKPEYLELELTEKILVDNIRANIQRLNLIKKIGIQISLDDFGKGYSSLGYLQQFPFDILKIDRCFISQIDRHSTNAVITKTIISMAHQLNLNVVAEGVETQAELDFLSEHGCDEMQGYLFSRPLPAKDFEQLLLSRKCLEKLKVGN